MSIFDNILPSSNRNARTVKHLKSYLSQRYDLLKLELLEKSSKILTVIFSVLVVIVCLTAALIYFSLALIGWLNNLFKSPETGYVIVSLFFILIICVVLIFKNCLFLNPLIKKLSSILFEADGFVVEDLDDSEEEEEGGDDDE